MFNEHLNKIFIMKTTLNLIVFVFIFKLICNVESVESDENLRDIETGDLPPTERKSFSELAAEYGFPTCEDKIVITDDGYILTLHHIPGDPQRPVLLAHGNTVDAACWVDRGNTSMAVVLAKRGYDVWAINFRGTTLSRRHLYLDAETQKEQFYNYTVYEQGALDLPATIDLILNETKQTQLLAIGHSLGTTNFYVLGSERPEYNDKIKLFISLAPISFLQHLRGVTTLGVEFGKPLCLLSKLFNVSEVVGADQADSHVLDDVCYGDDSYEICVNGILFAIFGYDPNGFEPGFERTFFRNFPEGTSMKVFTHLLQIIDSNKFARYDYGPEGNLVEYGTSEPPEFDLSKACMNMALFVGSEDYVASVPDAERLRDALPNVVHYQVLPYSNFNHLDFLWGQYMPTNFYPYVMPVIEKYIGDPCLYDY